jgi:hypothetical protein
MYVAIYKRLGRLSGNFCRQSILAVGCHGNQEQKRKKEERKRIRRALLSCRTKVHLCLLSCRTRNPVVVVVSIIIIIITTENCAARWAI